MKKLFSLSALCALMYAMPMNACMLLGILPHYDPTPVILLPIALFLAVQALLLQYASREISYPKALLMACVGNIPSTLIGYFPLIWQSIGYLFPIMDITLTTITISLIFRYPSNKIVRSIVVSAVAFYVIALLWALLGMPGIRLPRCC